MTFSKFPWQQEQLKRTLKYARVKAFSRTSLFLERFWREYWIPVSFKFHKQVSKTYRPKNNIFFAFSFPFWYLLPRMVEILFFCGKMCPKMCLKINWFIKTPWHRLSMRVTRSGSAWIPGIIHPCKQLTVIHHGQQVTHKT